MATAEELVVRASLKDELSRPVSAIRREVKGLREEADRTSRSAIGTSKSLDRMSSGAGRLARATGRGLVLGLKATAAGIAAVSAAAVLGGAKLLSLASDAAETGSAFATVFRGVSGDVAGYVDRMNKRFGITTAELQRAATTFGVFGKAAGISKRQLGSFTKDLVGAGLDLASFYNADPTEVFQALRSGLAGEAEPLRQFGIFLSDATMKAQAAQMGLTGELTEGQKVAVRQAIIMKSLGDANGDLARTSGGLANQWRKFTGQLREGATVVGTALLPVVTPLVRQLTEKLGPVVERLSDRLPGLTARWMDTGHQLGVTLGLFRAGEWDLAVANLDRITGAGGRLEGAFGLLRGIVRDVRDVVAGGLLPAIQDVTGAIDPAWLTPLGAARAALGFLADHTTAVHVALTGLIAAVALYRGAQLAATAVDVIANGVRFVQTATTYGLSYALKAGGTASKIYAAGQWALNAAMSANPISLLVIGIAALIAGIIIAYRKSETFRNIVQGLGHMFVWLKDRIMDAVGWIKKIHIPSLPGWMKKGFGAASFGAFGDTAVRRSRGTGGLDRTLGMHAQLAGSGVRVSNALIGGGGRGHGSGDHQRGRALDLVGTGLHGYKARLEKAGGYGAFHGDGSGRHLHAVYPAGDTATSRTGVTATTASGLTVLVPITVQGNASEVDRIELERAVRKAIRDADRERLERAGV